MRISLNAREERKFEPIQINSKKMSALEEESVVTGVASRSNKSISHMLTVGDSTSEIFCVRFDHQDNYIAAGCGDSTIKIFNIASGKMSFLLANPYLGEF